ncbi:RIP metalloprotease RseP [Entomomonas sp. E2T0]|uniref:RIP metalloprotease RseP n=1 Tax=Entomomonas sp. E2T0 TaxID=2930213 RepID=UPI00222819AC|nr:RIP metalloprotease RseP [Entomomonas sp. E2T0]UYZ84804.1 RIP metalloprotease RseP [Entomomonas sp. E2T0]
MSMLLGALIALGVLVTIHEFGHFWVARRCGVEVIRFSIGFGKPLIRWRDRRGTEYVIAMIPLGGYVKMLDERETEQEIPPEKLSYTFNRKSVGQRIAIVAAGPLANFILAFLLFWVLALIGAKVPIPTVGKVFPESIAATAGLTPMSEIIAVDNKATATWEDINIQLFKRLGESGNISITVKDSSLQERTYQLAINNWLRGLEKPNPLEGIGIEPYRPVIEPMLASVVKAGPAEQAGLQKGDLIKSFNNEPITDWQILAEQIKKFPNKRVVIGYERNGQDYSAQVSLTTMPNMPDAGYMGIEIMGKITWPDSMVRHVNYGVIDGMVKSLDQTWAFTFLTLESIKKMFTGEMSVKNLSGPIGIVKVAGSSFDSGFIYFIKFLALFSVSLGILNLLPIPVLDGGHLLFYIIEWIRGRPISEEIQGAALQIGVFLMIGVMLFAIMNDLNWL